MSVSQRVAGSGFTIKSAGARGAEVDAAGADTCCTFARRPPARLASSQSCHIVVREARRPQRQPHLVIARDCASTCAREQRTLSSNRTADDRPLLERPRTSASHPPHAGAATLRPRRDGGRRRPATSGRRRVSGASSSTNNPKEHVGRLPFSRSRAPRTPTPHQSHTPQAPPGPAHRARAQRSGQVSVCVCVCVCSFKGESAAAAAAAAAPTSARTRTLTPETTPPSLVATKKKTTARPPRRRRSGPTRTGTPSASACATSDR